MAAVASRHLSDHDAKVLSKVQHRAHRLDRAFNICCVKIGWGSIIGLIPAVGDVLDFSMAAMVIHQAGQVEGAWTRASAERCG